MIKIDDIKSALNPLEIYRRFIPDLDESFVRRQGQKGKNASSPFSEDKNPSFSLYEKGGKLLFKCHSTGRQGDEFEFFSQIKGIDQKNQFPLLLKEINREFRLNLNGSNSDQVVGTNWGVTYQPFTEEAKKWASSRGIDTAVMLRYGVQQLTEAWFFGDDGKKRKFTFPSPKLAFRMGAEGLKIYQPTWDGQEKKIYRGPGATNEAIFGFNQLPDDKVEMLLILEGETDVLCAVSQGFYAVCFQNAGVKPTKEQIRKLRKKACEIVVCYDNDKAGQAGAKFISNQYDIPKCRLPEAYNDVCDYLPKSETHLDEFSEIIEKAWQIYRVKNSLMLVERDGGYWRPTFDKEKKEWSWTNLKFVTDFRIEVEAFIYSGSGSKRIVQLVNTKGEVKSEVVSTDTFTSVDQFRKFLAGLGGFNFQGTINDLVTIQRMTFQFSAAGEEVNTLGYSRQHDAWILGNGIIKNGAFMAPDKMGMVEGLYLPWASEENEFAENYAVARTYSFQETELEVKDWFAALSECFGVIPAIIGVSFVLATLNFDYIARRNNRFAELMIWGQKGSGKNSYGELLYSIFGRDIQPALLSNLTTSFLSRSIAQTANIPKWYDEYDKNMPENVKQILKGFYDLSSRGTGVKDLSSNTKQGKVLTSAFITGQELPTDNEALLSRMILIQFDVKNNPELYQKFQSCKLKLDRGMGKAFMQLLNMRKAILDNFEKRFQEIARKLSDDLVAANLVVNSRLVMNYASIVTPLVISVEAGLPIFEGESNSEVEIILACVIDNMKRQAEFERTADEVNVFWQYFLQMIEGGLLIENLHFVIGEVKKEKYLGIRGFAFSEFSRHYQNINRKAFIPNEVLISYIKKRAYYARYDKQLSYFKTLDDKLKDKLTLQVKGHQFHFHLLPDFVKEFFEEQE